MRKTNSITIFSLNQLLSLFDAITIFLQNNHMSIEEQEKIAIERLKAERERQKLSQLELSYRSGVSQNMIAYIEGGKRIPTLSTVLKLCNALNINPSVLFSYDSDKKRAIKAKIAELINLL